MKELFDEVLARNLVHGAQHCRIADPAPAQAEQELHAADIVVARRLLGHAESSRIDLSRKAPPHQSRG